MGSNSEIESGIQQLRNLRWLRHAKGIYDACSRIDRELERLQHKGGPALRAARAQVLGESELLRSFNLGRTDRTLERADSLSREDRAESVPLQPPIVVVDGNWSQSEMILGEIIPVKEAPSRVLRETSEGIPVFLYRGRPSVAELANWPKIGCMIVASSGGLRSEDMNYASSQGLRYINGIGEEQYEGLVAMRGRVVRVTPPDVMRDRVSLEGAEDSLPAISFILHLFRDSANRRFALHFLYWAIGDHPSALRDALSSRLDLTHFEADVAEAREYDPRDYSESLDCSDSSGILRALGRLGAARERGEDANAKSILTALPAELRAPLGQR